MTAIGVQSGNRLSPCRCTFVNLFLAALFLQLPIHARGFTRPLNLHSSAESSALAGFGTDKVQTAKSMDIEGTNSYDIFNDFVEFLQSTQNQIIQQIEEMDGSGSKFTKDPWGVFDESTDQAVLSGGITRVLQGGNVVEKGACSLTLIRRGILSAERAATIRARQDIDIQPGDAYYAAALSIVLHSRSPMVPTFRSDVRIFLVQSDTAEMAWFGYVDVIVVIGSKSVNILMQLHVLYSGGADLTPYFLFDEDVIQFHTMYRDLCRENPDEFSYQQLKKSCDEYFYLPARDEHRGTGGIFFDDMPATEAYALPFVKSVASAWMPSWLPIVEQRRNQPFSDKQKQWQLLRRGRYIYILLACLTQVWDRMIHSNVVLVPFNIFRYLEFNLLYDRGVKFGLANTNPRVEGVMVSAPPLIAWEYNHKIEVGSEEERLMKILKVPIDWLQETK